jgi:hypothetical protein
MGEEQLPWKIPYRRLSMVLLYEVSDTPNHVAIWWQKYEIKIGAV